MATPSYITHTFAASVVVSSKLGMMSQMSLVTIWLMCDFLLTQFSG